MSYNHIKYKNKQGKLFVPINIAGGTSKENFITTPKIATICVILGITAWLIMTFIESSLSFISKTIIMLAWLFVVQLAVRYIVFEEKYYYKMYKELQKNEITSPSLFWDIAFMKDTDEGAILTYNDYKVGIIIKLDRGTITGQTEEFREQHYNTIADFYSELLQKKYKFVQLNIMEQSGNDKRIVELEKLIHKSDNKNIRRLMELEVGYIKSITTHSLYDNDYLLIYSEDTSRTNYIIGDIAECSYKLLDGAYTGFRVLNTKDIIELVKEEYGVKYFNYTDATLDMYKNNSVVREKPFNLVNINFKDKDKVAVSQRALNYILKLASDKLNRADNDTQKSLKDSLVELDKKQDKKVEFNELRYKKENVKKGSEEFLSLFDGSDIDEKEGNTLIENQGNIEDDFQQETESKLVVEEVVEEEDEIIDF